MSKQSDDATRPNLEAEIERRNGNPKCQWQSPVTSKWKPTP